VKNLRRLRESKEISQQKLAEKFGLAQAQIHAYESNAYEPDISTLKRFAEFFETSVDYIVGNTDIKHKIEAVEKHDLNKDEASLIKKYRILPSAVKKSVMVMIDALLEKE